MLNSCVDIRLPSGNTNELRKRQVLMGGLQVGEWFSDNGFHYRAIFGADIGDFTKIVAAITDKPYALNNKGHWVTIPNAAKPCNWKEWCDKQLRDAGVVFIEELVTQIILE